MPSRGKSWHYRCRNRVYIKHHHHDNHHNLIYIAANNIIIARIYRFCDSPTSDNIVDTYTSSHPVARERLRRGGSGCRCCARCEQRRQAAATGAWSALWAYPGRVAASTHLTVLWQFFCVANTFFVSRTDPVPVLCPATAFTLQTTDQFSDMPISCPQSAVGAGLPNRVGSVGY